MAMKANMLTVVKGDGSEWVGESVLMRDDNISAVYWVQKCHGGKNEV